MKGGAKVIIEAHRHEGVFIARSKEDALVTLNSTPGASKLVIAQSALSVQCIFESIPCSTFLYDFIPCTLASEYPILTISYAISNYVISTIRKGCVRREAHPSGRTYRC